MTSHGGEGFDFAALEAPLDAKAVREFAVQRSGRSDYWSAYRRASVISWIVLTLITMGVVTLIGGALEPILRGFFGVTLDVPEYFAAAAGLGIGLILAPILGVFPTRFEKQLVQAFRLEAFAKANGLTFGWATLNPDAMTPHPIGAIFTVPNAHDTRVSPLATGERWVRFRTGECELGLPLDERDSMRTWVFLELFLDGELPHIVLESRGGSRIPEIPLDLSAEETLSLEGDFDRTYTVRAAQGVGSDVLRVLPPDIMALLQDSPINTHVEFVDDRVYFYADKSVGIDSPLWWQFVDMTLSGIGAKTARMAGRARFATNSRDVRIPQQDRKIERAVRSAGILLIILAIVGILAAAEIVG